MKQALGIDHSDEKEFRRVQAVNKYATLTSAAKKALDEVTQLAREIFHVQLALVCFVDLHQVFVKSSSAGTIPGPADRTTTLCSRAIKSSDITVINNKEMEDYLFTNPLIAREQGLEFYAAAPLITSEGLNIGTFCLLDRKNRSFFQEDKDILERFSRIVMSELELCHSSIVSIDEC